MNVDCVVATALKQAENGEGFILRMVEYNGEQATESVRLKESESGCLAFAPYEIKTLYYHHDGAVTQTDLLKAQE